LQLSGTGAGVRASQLYNARGKKLLPPPVTSSSSLVSTAVQTSSQNSNSSSNNNLKRRSEAASRVGWSLKKSLQDQHQHSKSHSEIVLLRRDESLHSIAAQSQVSGLAEGKGLRNQCYKTCFGCSLCSGV